MKVLEHMQLLMEIDGTLPATFDSNLLAKTLKLILIFVGPVCTFLSIIGYCIVNADDFELLVVAMYNVIGVSLCTSLNIAFCCESKKMKNFLIKLDSLVNKSKCFS